ncbi:uncharacterized protein J3D65DRAFT_672737 [Phyllosticta citribraziliensis]|uniref:Uncharacterized protein n=1 Tax=Phyllosticta citribraziliensis TaxID=989973 RepID=A0ABR1L1N9_9PEZI
MTDSSTTSTPPPAEQGQPTRPPSFDASWDATDASAFDPASLPLAKAPRAWERQPHSPFARTGKYRKVWKRNELRTTRSQTKTGDGKESLNQDEDGGMQSPRKIVKKRVLDAPPEDPTATPGRVRPKSKAFAPTRYDDSPRRHSGRIARKLVSMDHSESSSATYGSVWTGEQAKGSMGSRRASLQIIKKRDSLSLDNTLFETTTATVQDSATSETAREETADEVDQDSASLSITSEQEAEEQVVEQAAEEDEGSPTREVNAKDENRDISFQADAASRAAPLEAVDSEASGQDTMPESGVADTGSEETLELENAAEQLGSADALPIAAPEDKPQHRVVEVSEEQDSDALQPETAPEITSPATAAPGSAPTEAIADSDSIVHDGTTGGSEMLAQSRLEADNQDRQQFETAIPETDTINHDAQEPEAEVSVQEAVTESNEEGTADAFEEGSVAQRPDVQQDEEQEEPDRSAQLENEVEDSTQDAGFSTSPVEPPRRPNLEFSASSLFGEALDTDDGEKEPESAEADLNETGSDGSEDAEDSLIDMPSPSLSNTESPRFASVADTLTLHLPENLSSREEDGSEEDASLESPTDADTAYLKEFLSRSDAAKANRTASMSKRESFTNRRDSGRVRQALASPRVALESKDPNSPLSGDSPSKRSRSEEELKPSIKKPRLEAEAKVLPAETASQPSEDITADLTLDQTPTEKKEPTPEPRSTRRSSRARTTRIPSTAAAPAPNRIPVRRADGNEPVVLKKTEAQELAIATRTNTRRNKGGAVAAPARLKKLQAEALKAEPSPSGSPLVCSNPDIEIFEASMIKWDQQLVYFQDMENPTPESLSDDELASGGVDESLKSKRATTPRARRTRGLGASNGTPAKGLLAPANLLPESVQAEVEATKSEAKKPAKVGRPKKASTPAKQTTTGPPTNLDPLASLVESAEKPRKETPIPLPKPNPPKFPPSQLPTPAPVTARKSRLQSPKKIKLPGPVQPAAKQAQSKAGGVGITGGTPKKMPVTRLGATSGENTANATGSSMSIGQRRRAGRRA